MSATMPYVLVMLAFAGPIALAECERDSTRWCAAVAAGAPRVWVCFTDKAVRDPADREARCLAFAATLDPHTRMRRARMLGATAADACDLPLHEPYLDELRTLGARIVRSSRWLNAVSVRAPLESLVAIAALPFVSKLQPVAVFRGTARDLSTHRASGTGTIGAEDAFAYGPSREQLREIGVLPLHARGLRGAGVVIAMLDTGFDWQHPVFQHIVTSGRLLAQYDFLNDDGETRNQPGDDPDQQAHGTIVWSVLAGLAPGQLVGPAPGASFLLAKTEDVTSETRIEEDHWIAAAEWADQHGADVISSSLIYTDWYTYADMDGDTAPITKAADVAATRGIVVCNAAGNSGTDDFYYIGAPADGNFVMAVGATRPDGSRADLSSHGPSYDGRVKPDVMARGDDTWAAVPLEWGGGYRSFSGTSVACPLVSGSVALLLEARPELTPYLVWHALTATADQADHPDGDRGYGRIRIDRALLSR